MRNPKFTYLYSNTSIGPLGTQLFFSYVGLLGGPLLKMASIFRDGSLKRPASGNGFTEAVDFLAPPKIWSVRLPKSLHILGDA